MKRITDAYITKKIIIGTESWDLPNSKLETHGWRFYIRGCDTPLNMSNPPDKSNNLNFIRKVTVTLHETFPNPTRDLTYPFEITERGWGEFTIHAKIYFNDKSDRCVTLSHQLKLFETETDLESENTVVKSERVETIVFRSPSRTLFDILNENVEVEESDSDTAKLDQAIEWLVAEIEK